MSTDLLRSDARLGRVPDSELAAALGVSRQLVSRARKQLGIARPAAPVSGVDPAADPRLGTMTDTALASLLGCSRYVVSRARIAAGLPVYEPSPVETEITRRRLIVAIAQADRPWAGVATALGWTHPSLRRKLAPPETRAVDRRALTPEDVKRIAAVLGLKVSALVRIDVVPGDEAALFDLLAQEGHSRPWGYLTTRYGAEAVARLIALGFVLPLDGLAVLTSTGRRAAVA